MKKIFTTLGAVLFVAAMGVGFGSCTKKMQIIGEWQVVEECEDDDDDCEDIEDEDIFITFDKDGTYETVEDGKTKLEGEWKISDDVLTLDPDKGSKTKFRIKKLKGKDMVLKEKGDDYSIVLEKR